MSRVSVSLEEKIDFLESIVIPSFDADHNFTTVEERKDSMANTAMTDGWQEKKAELLLRIYNNISTVDEAMAKLEALQQRQQQGNLLMRMFVIVVRMFFIVMRDEDAYLCDEG